MVFGSNVINIIIRAKDEFSKTLNNANVSVKEFSRTIGIAGAAITGFGIAGAGAITAIVSQAGKFEQTKTAFTTMLGSEEKALEMLKELTDFASKTPFTIPGVEQGAKQLLAMGFATDEVIPNLKRIGDITAGLGLGQQGLDRMVFNMGQIRAQGKAMTIDIRQFAKAGVPIYEELAKVMGVSEAEVAALVTEGKVGFPEIEQAMINMTSEGGKFFNLMDAQSKTFLGQVSNIQDEIIKLARIMGEVLLPAAKWIAEKLQIVIGWMQEHPTIAKFGMVLLVIGTALALVIGPLMILIALLPALAGGIGIITAVSSPWLLIIIAVIAAIAALIAIGYFLIKHWDTVKTAGMIFFNFLAKIFAPQIARVKLAIKALGMAFKWMWDHGFSAVWEKLKGLYTWIKDKFLWILNKAISLLSKFAEGRAKAGASIEARGNKVLGSFQTGGTVPETGLYNLHKGENVIPANMSQSQGTTIIIEGNNIYGTDPDDIAGAIQENISDKIKY